MIIVMTRLLMMLEITDRYWPILAAWRLPGGSRDGITRHC